jgi:hypothetical protein
VYAPGAEGKLAADFSRHRQESEAFPAIFSCPQQESVGFPHRFLAPPTGISGLPTTGSNGAHEKGRLKHSCSHLLAEALAFPPLVCPLISPFPPQHLSSTDRLHLAVKSVRSMYKFLIDSCGFVADMAWRRRRRRALRFGGSYF